MFFYELHEGDNEVYADVLVVSESEWEPEEFFELVQTIRRRIQDGYIHDTLSEAIAVELERDHGFVHISDDRLVASVNISTDDAENYLAELEVDLADAAEDEDDDDIDPEQDLDDGTAYSTIVAEFDPGSRLN
ncbi:MAG: hypothetical protein QOI37_1185 [Chloroflexota bacterium]|nr:hypothetical protein [Chloroflexota bacterium]MEA2653958.1 hypothetical protein [Chloroflexota bacterium]